MSLDLFLQYSCPILFRVPVTECQRLDNSKEKHLYFSGEKSGKASRQHQASHECLAASEHGRGHHLAGDYTCKPGCFGLLPMVGRAQFHS